MRLSPCATAKLNSTRHTVGSSSDAFTLTSPKLSMISCARLFSSSTITCERIAARTSLEVQYGGGIKSRTALCDVFSAGARRAVCGSIAVREPDCLAAWLAEFGGERLILGADLRDGRIAIAGWLEETPLGAAELIGRFRKQGLQQVICTDIARDGMLCGPAVALYADLQRRFPQVEITVSGGVSSPDDIARLEREGLRSVIVGKALYEGRITLEDLGRCLPNE